jgi:hypothetical protein
MASIDMNRLMDTAKIRLPGALEGTIQNELFYVLNEFFQTSNIWYEDVTFAVAASTDSYVDNPDAYTFEVLENTGVFNRLLGVANSQGVPQSATMATPGFIVLKFLPSVDDIYTARIAKTVTDPVTKEGYPEFPNWILNKYGNNILDGVLARMMSQTAKPYSNPQMAAVHARQFKGSVSQAKVEAQHQNVYRGQNWSFPQSFARRRYVKF